MANFLTVRKFSNLAASTFVDQDILFYNQRKYSRLAPAKWNLQDSYSLGERKYGTFPDGETFVINLPPVVDNPIPDQEILEGNLYNFIVPNDTFSDPDGDLLILTATLDDDSPLPSWLTFNSFTETFTGVASHSEIGIINIKVTATDPFGSSVSDIFSLEVLEDLTLKTRDLFKAFRTLLPDGRAWNIDLSVVFKQLIDAIMDSAADVKEYFLRVKNDVFPDSTEALDLWEEQFLLDGSSLTESERRSNLAARWSSRGGQSANYIEGILLKLEIVAKVYENFGRADPNSFLIGGDSEILINGDIIFEEKNFIHGCGEPLTVCEDDDSVQCGDFDGFTTKTKQYIVSTESKKYVHYFIVADPASVFTPLDVPAAFEKAFKLAILRVKPAQTRAILNVNYV